MTSSECEVIKSSQEGPDTTDMSVGCPCLCPWVIVNLISSRTYYHGPGPWCNFKCLFPRTRFDLSEFQDKESFYAAIVVAWDIREAIFIWQDAEFNQVNPVGIN